MKLQTDKKQCFLIYFLSSKFLFSLNDLKKLFWKFFIFKFKHLKKYCCIYQNRFDYYRKLNILKIDNFRNQFAWNATFLANFTTIFIHLFIAVFKTIAINDSTKKIVSWKANILLKSFPIKKIICNLEFITEHISFIIIESDEN